MDFRALQSKQKEAFNEHRALVKKVLKGRQVNCKTCNKPLVAQVIVDQKKIEIKCQKGCTDLLLDIDI
jgi:hypothetical protein